MPGTEQRSPVSPRTAPSIQRNDEEGNVKVLRVCDQMYVLRTFQWVVIDPATRKVM